ncbi:hypothetical protein QTP88_018169 [Uroleucon formosanum]
MQYKIWLTQFWQCFILLISFSVMKSLKNMKPWSCCYHDSNSIIRSKQLNLHNITSQLVHNMFGERLPLFFKHFRLNGIKYFMGAKYLNLYLILITIMTKTLTNIISLKKKIFII